MLTSWEEARIIARALEAIHGDKAPQAAMALAADQPAHVISVLAAAAGLLINPQWTPDAREIRRAA